jgi:hypothetical protein
MTTDEPEERQSIFIVRLTRGPSGRITGVVERVRTQEKRRFTTFEEVGVILAGLLAREEGGFRSGHGKEEGQA